MRVIKQLLLFLLLVAGNYSNASNNKSERKETRQHPLDIVFCIDLSGSTNGLIDDVREQLWMIINQAHELQPAPDLRIGIIGFSRPSFGKEKAYVKVLANLTNDFDSLAFELYKLKPTVEQGDQYVNAALTIAMNEMNWGKEENNSKIIFIVGNGMASGRGVDIISTCAQLSKRHFVVNSLFVESKGRNQSQALGGWKKIADLTHGLQSEITVGKKDAVIDVEMNNNALLDLNHQLNSTYLYHNEKGKINYRRLHDLDSALHLAGIAEFYQRIWYKQSSWFQNTQSNWDLVDYIKSVSGDLEKIDKRTMPDSLQFYSIVQLRELIISQKETRETILRNVRLLYAGNYIDTIHQKFLNHEFPDTNIFSRCVINMLLKEWR